MYMYLFMYMWMYMYMYVLYFVEFVSVNGKMYKHVRTHVFLHWILD